MSAARAGALEGARADVRVGLGQVAKRLRAEGMPAPGWTGQLIRPVAGWAAAGAAAGGERADERLWAALAAVQLAHEASLVHDDVVDGASSRRGEPTLAAAKGVAAALVEGDHLLTAAYRVASWTGSAAWMTLFARAVERTVAGEKAQARSAGGRLGRAEYDAIVMGKSGELLGAAVAAAAALRGDADVERWAEAGRRLGLVYQMLDDLLDYAPHLDTGKPALGDYRRGLWTWPQDELALEPGLDDGAIVARLRTPDAAGVLPLRRCVDRLRAVAGEVRAELAALAPAGEVLPALLDDWLAAADAAVTPLELPDTAGWRGLMATHGRTFRLASRLFPAEVRERVEGVYAWCRYTDDLVDRSDLPAAALVARLEAWRDISRRAWHGETTGHALADAVMPEMAAAGVPFGYAEELIEGMLMDVRGTTYGTHTALCAYTYRVAGVVGLWVTELVGIRDPWLLDRAATLGRAMQLTNILRDVGEDLRRGRVYLPASWLAAYGLGEADLRAMMAAGRVSPAYAEMVEALLQVAEQDYDDAFPAIRRLPGFYRRPVAVAADVYRGIHDRIRRAGYDNLTRRASAPPWTRVRLGARALWRGRGGAAAAAGPAPAAASGTGWTDAARRAALGLGAGLVLLAAAPFSSASGQSPAVAVAAAPSRLDGVRALWRLGVEDEAAVSAGLASVARIRAEDPDGPGRAVLEAYEGSLLALRAKHGAWPGARLRDVREGFARLDAAVAARPDHPEVRYVRLMSGFHLPRIFGRGDAVEADLDALPALLAGSGDALPAALRSEIAAFLLDHADPAPEVRARLEALASEARGAAGTAVR